MASVYLVRHTSLGTRHALKVLHIGGPRLQARLVREGRAQGDLRSPNVVAVTDIVDIGGSPGLVLELIDGPGLDELLATVRLTVDEADRIGRGVLRGVAAAHRAGLVHRDLKPANVLVAALEHDLIPKVADFGVAKLLEGDDEVKATRSGLSLGTPAYMAPEQIESAKHVDARADVFSLGALLYELLTGVRAFEDTSVLTTYNRVATGDYEPLDEAIPERMRRAVEGALRVDPAERFADAGALLEAWADGTPEPGPEVVRASTLDQARQLVEGRAETFEVPRAPETLELPDPAVASAPTELRAARPERWRRLRVLGLALGVTGLSVTLIGTTMLAITTRPVSRPVASVPEPAAAPMGQVTVESTVRVELVAEDGTTWPGGEVPPGIYRVRLWSDGEPQVVREISVVQGRSGTLACREVPPGCTWTTP